VKKGVSRFRSKCDRWRKPHTEKNVEASLDHAQSLLQARDLTEIMRLHSDYGQAQMRSLAGQASEMSQIVGQAAMDAAKPKS
jgi:hypothetical protein